VLNFDLIAEQRIREAAARGDLDNLPGAGRPLVLDDDLLVPDEARIACRILKNAGLVPLELIERKEIASLEAALPKLEAAARVRALAKLALLRTRLGERRATGLAARREYARKIVEKPAGS